MKSSAVFQRRRRLGAIRFGLSLLSVLLSSAAGLAQDKQKSKPAASETPAANPKATATPVPSPTPETKIDARTEAELLQAEDRFVNAIRNRDEKALEELLHPYFADSIEGRSAATTKRGVIVRATAGRLPAYAVERQRKLIRSGDTFTVEGLGKDVSHDLSEDQPREKWAQVRRLWSNEGGHWIATAQIITPLDEHELKEKLESESKEKH